jgi:poly(hydroxyalkanoate) depolymerase family esterase
MNELAEQHGFAVVYPAQARTANSARCWNWFAAENQARGSGEPSLIAGITEEVAGRVRVDRRRIFVAGHSAGAAMAVVLGEAYPDLYAGIGVHSGLPFASAHDVGSALAAMHGRSSLGKIAIRMINPLAAPPPKPRITQAVPTIVFHGDTDPTVAASNGAVIIEQAVALAAKLHPGAPLQPVEQHGAAGGRSYRRTTYTDGNGGPPLIEEWVLHGAGHGWSGGADGAQRRISDPRGPDASAEMVRFFLALPRNEHA